MQYNSSLMSTASRGASLACDPHPRVVKGGVMSPDQETRLTRLEDEVGILRAERERLLIKMRGIAQTGHPELQLTSSTKTSVHTAPVGLTRFQMNRCFSSSSTPYSHGSGFGPGSLSSHHLSTLSQPPQTSNCLPSSHQHINMSSVGGGGGEETTASIYRSSIAASTGMRSAASTATPALKDPGSVTIKSSVTTGRCAEVPSASTGGQHKTTYQMSQDLEDLQIKLIERKYGGTERAQRATRIIQAAYRDHSMRRNFKRLKACTQTCLLQSSRLTLLSASSAASSMLDLAKGGPHPHPPPSSSKAGEEQRQEDDAVLERAYGDWESIDSSAMVGTDAGSCPAAEAGQETRHSSSTSSTPTPKWLPLGDPSSVQCETALELIYSHASSESEGSSPQSTTISVPAMSLLPSLTSIPTNPPRPPPRRTNTTNDQHNHQQHSWEAAGSSCRDSGVSSSSTTSSSELVSSLQPPPVPPHANQQQQTQVRSSGGLMTTSRDSGVDADSPCSSQGPVTVVSALRTSVCSSCSTSSTSSCDTAGLKPSDSQSSITSSSTASSQTSCPSQQQHQQTTNKPHHPRCPSRLLVTTSNHKLTAPSPIWKRKDDPPPAAAPLRQLSNQLPLSYHNLPRHQQTLPSLLPPPGARCVAPTLSSQQLPQPAVSRKPASVSYSSHGDSNAGGCKGCQSSSATLHRHRVTTDMRRKRIYRIGLNLFNKKPDKGLQFMMRYSFVENCPETMAKFLMSRKGLSRQMIGEYLGDTQSSFNQQVLHFFAKDIDLTGLEIDEAMRKFFSYFRLPGESQKIGHILEVFASHYLQCQTSQGDRAVQLGSAADRARIVDTLYVLAYAVVMLNTDLHNANVKKEKKMRLEEFLRNLRGMDGGRDFDPGLLSRVYQRVQDREFEPAPDHTTQVRRIADALVSSPGIPSTAAGLVQSHRRMVCFCRMQEVVDSHRKSKPTEHAREVFLFNDLLLVTKATPRKSSKLGGPSSSIRSNTTSTPVGPNPSPSPEARLSSSAINSAGNTSSPLSSTTAAGSGGSSTTGTETMYTCKHAYSLVGVYAALLDTPLYPFAVQLRRSMDDTVLVTLCAKTASDRERFFEDVQECILEMSEMEAMRIEEELVKQHRMGPNSSSSSLSGSHQIVPPSQGLRSQHVFPHHACNYDVTHQHQLYTARHQQQARCPLPLGAASSSSSSGKGTAANSNSLIEASQEMHRMSDDSGLQVDL